MIYKNNILLPLYVLLCIYILIVQTQTILKISHKNVAPENYDITTIYRIKDMASNKFHGKYDGFKNSHFLHKYNGSYSVEIHSRTNAIGIPIQKHDITNNYIISQTNVNEFFTNESIFQTNSRINVSYNTDDWEKVSIRLTGHNCKYDDFDMNFDVANEINTNGNCIYGSYRSKYETEYYSCRTYNRCYNALQYRYDHDFLKKYSSFVNNNYYTFFSLHWMPDKMQKCFTITYIHRSNSKVKIVMNLYNENNTIITSTQLEKDEDIKTLKVTDIILMKDEKYKLSLQMKMYESDILDDFITEKQYTGIWFGLLRIAECSNYDEEDVRIIVPTDNSFNLKPFHIINGPEATETAYSYVGKSCLNGGFIKSSKCICPPGFIGQFCETGCGLNSYGDDCKGICSVHADKMCRGIYMCTKYGCTCPPGLTGVFCNEDCKLGKYGADCQQTCSSSCYNNTCDRYTGVCSEGCLPGYILPYCKNKYPYLINPPQLRVHSAKYDTVEIDWFFQPENIESEDKNLNLKFYQLIYKSLKEETFRYSEIKLIDQNNKSSTDVISDLESQTTYKIGVLLITHDLNFNDQNIEYGTIKTSCMIPQNTNYNIKLISGIKSINVTWNKIISNHTECNVTEYALTLMANQSQNQITDIQEIVSRSDNGHFIDDLLPGLQYNLKLTPKTDYGPLQSSPTYTITTLIKGNDIVIKDIETQNVNGKLKVYWKLVNSHQHYTIVNEPVSCIVKYKIKRILSCSMSELENNWTSITILNQTNYEILDPIPFSQYSLQILISDMDINMIQQGNMVHTLTPASIPKTEPIIDLEHPMIVTNNSVFVQWKVDPMNCSQLNGLFSIFYIELHENEILKTEETKQNYISFDDLKSNTAYKLKVFIKTHNGYNPDHFLLVNFSTKFENLKPVDDLMVYKKSLKNRTVGLRWSYVENTNIDGFIVSFNKDAYRNTQNDSIIPLTKCSAWPKYYCHTFYNLNPGNSYTFKIKPKSPDYPEGGKVSSISFSNFDGLPDSPSNILAYEIGNTTISIQWDIPWIFNSILEMFIINVEEITAIDMDKCCVGVTPIELVIDEELPTYKYTLMDLNPGSTYSIGVIAVTKSLWYSPPARISVTTLKET